MSLPDSAIQILEDECILSESMIWPMIETYYGSSGPKAWHETPYYPTSNAFIGETYAQLIAAFLRDIQPNIIASQPIYILEMAAGIGAFSFFLLRALQRIRSTAPSIKALPIRYIITDFTENNISVLENDPVFQTFEAEGILDYAIYTPEKEVGFKLRRSGVEVVPGSLANPLIAIANYFFDSIRHDFFRVEDGQLKEGRVRAFRKLPLLSSPQIKPRLSEMALSDRYVNISSEYYKDPALNRILRSYVEAGGPASFLFPIGAFRVLSNLNKLSNNRLLLLATDKGFGTRDYTKGLSEVPFTPHTGSFSYMVNFDAIGAYFKNANGVAWHAHENPTFTTMAASSLSATQLEQTFSAAEIWLRTINPARNGYQLCMLLSQFGPIPSCDNQERFRIATACVHLSFYDPMVFARAGEHLCEGYNAHDFSMRSLLEDILIRVEGNVHRSVVGARESLGYLRRLYYINRDFTACLRINRLWTQWFEDQRDVHFYPAAVFEQQGEITAALLEYRKALALDPESEICRAAIERLSRAEQS